MRTVEIKDKATLRQIEVLVSRLRRRQIVGALESAQETVVLLRQIVSSAKFSSIEQLIEMIKGAGKRLVDAQPKAHSVGNIVRKVLHLIREEYNAAVEATGATSPPSASIHSTPRPMLRSLSGISTPTTPATPSTPFTLSNFVLLGHPRLHQAALQEAGTRTPQSKPTELLAIPEENSKKSLNVKPALIQAIQEVIDELETVYENVAKNAKDHIHADEIILTIGKSKTVEEFIKAAARDRRFTVIVAETAPSYAGREMAASLAADGISTVLVPDSAIYALMSRVNKVVLGAHAILANGGIFAVAGSLIAASAARAHATPVVVCSGQFKLTPRWNLYHEYAAVDFGDPRPVLGSEDEDFGGVELVNPYYDYVKPELLDVLITNYGDHSPSYAYRLIKETYDDEDLEF